ncbi:MAG: hypothetical protein IANPNBLG_01895 [Bryobacteraceae bacterium]|nr:hypothetical protein [Bryobacteraceae bacterium]
MKRLAPIALLAAGKVRDSFLRRAPVVKERLGPVRSSSYRLASRISNILGAGFPVEHLDAFASCGVILISSPEHSICGAIEELAEAELDWKTKTVLLCNSACDSEALRRLGEAGAATGSITPVDGPDGRLYVAEGDRKAIAQARILVAAHGVKVIPMDHGRKSLYLAGVNFATGLALPLLAASVETLRATGVEQNDAVVIAERLFQRTLRAYVKGGRRAWEGELVVKNQQAIRRQVRSLFEVSPHLAAYFFQNAMQAVKLFRQDPQWLKELAEDAYPKAQGR